MPCCVIADSEDPRRRRFADLLVRLGFEVLEARCGADIRYHARTQDFHVLFVQSWLKDGTGAQAIDAFRDAYPSQDAHVVLLAEEVTEKLIRDALTAGADDYLADAFDADQLLFKIDLAAEQGRVPGWMTALEADRQGEAVGQGNAGMSGSVTQGQAASAKPDLRLC